MINDNQKQSVSANAVAVQAGGDVNFGMSYSEVRDLVNLSLRDNFPKLREEAMQIADGHIQLLLTAFETRLGKVADRIDANRFREPDVQAAINDAVMASARRGKEANMDILCALIAERVSVTPSHFKDMVLSEAIQVVPRLTAEQIKLLVLILIIRHFEPLKSEHTLVLYENIGHLVTPLLDSSIDKLSHVQISHIRYTGALEISGSTFAFDIFEHLNRSNSHFNIGKTADFKDLLKRSSPEFFSLIERFNEQRLGLFSLTSVGRAIALGHLSTVVPGLNYSEWLH